MKKIVKSLVDKVVQLYMENDYDYVVSKAKAGSRLREEAGDHMIEFLKRNSIVPADMLEEDIQKVADIAAKRIDEINAEVYKKYQLINNGRKLKMTKKEMTKKELEVRIETINTLIAAFGDANGKLAKELNEVYTKLEK